MNPRIKGLIWAAVVYFFVMFNVLQYAQGPAVNTGGGGSCGTGIANALVRWTGTTTCSTSSITDDGSSIVVKPTADSTSSVKIANAAGTALATFDTTNLSTFFNAGATTHIGFGFNANTGFFNPSGNTMQAQIGGAGNFAIMSLGTTVDRTLVFGLGSNGGITTPATAFSRGGVGGAIDGIMALGTGSAGSTAAWLQQAGMQRATADVTNATATLATITGTSRAVIAGETYGFDAYIPLTSDVADGVQVTIGGTATATSIWYQGLLFNGTTLAADTRSAALGGVVCALTATTSSYCEIHGTITVNAGGTLLVQFAQNTSTNSNVTTALRGTKFKIEDTP